MLTTMRMRSTKMPVLITESTEDAKLPIAKPMDAQDTINKQYVLIRIVIHVHRPVNVFRTAANTREYFGNHLGEDVLDTVIVSLHLLAHHGALLSGKQVQSLHQSHHGELYKPVRE